MKQITINEFEFTIPTNYQELNKKQLLLVGELIANNTAENQLKVLYTLLGLNKWTWKTRKHWKLILTLDSVWLHTLLTNVDLLGWIWSNTQIKEYRIKSFWLLGLNYCPLKFQDPNSLPLEVASLNQLLFAFQPVLPESL